MKAIYVIPGHKTEAPKKEVKKTESNENWPRFMVLTLIHQM